MLLICRHEDTRNARRLAECELLVRQKLGARLRDCSQLYRVWQPLSSSSESMRGVLVAALWLSSIALVVACEPRVRRSRRRRPAPPAAAPSREVLDRYCVGCHNQRLQTAALALDTLDATNIAAHADVWEKVVRKLRTRVMPPLGAPRPDEATYRALVEAVGDVARPQRRGASRSRRSGRSSSEPRRVRQRDSRSAGARRRHGVAAAGRRLGVRLRQRVGRPERLAVAAGALPVGGAKDQRARGRRCRESRRPRAPIGSGRIVRRISTWRDCRSAPSAGRSSATPFRWTASISFKPGCSGPTWA